MCRGLYFSIVMCRGLYLVLPRTVNAIASVVYEVQRRDSLDKAVWTSPATTPPTTLVPGHVTQLSSNVTPRTSRRLRSLGVTLGSQWEGIWFDMMAK